MGHCHHVTTSQSESHSCNWPQLYDNEETPRLRTPHLHCNTAQHWRVYIATAENIENATNNLIPHLLDCKGFYGNVIVSVNRGYKIRKCYLKKKINVKPHFRNGSSVQDLWFWIMLFWSDLQPVVRCNHHQTCLQKFIQIFSFLDLVIKCSCSVINKDCSFRQTMIMPFFQSGELQINK